MSELNDREKKGIDVEALLRGIKASGLAAQEKRNNELEARVEHLESMVAKLNTNNTSIIKQLKNLTAAHNRLKARFDVGGLTGELEQQLKKLWLWRKRFVLGRLKYRRARQEHKRNNP